MKTENIQPANKLHFCRICKTKPDQLSHHKTHLKSQIHLLKKKCFEQCIKMSSVLYYHMNTDELISMIKNETGLKFSENKENILGSWRLKLIADFDNLLKQDFPDVIIPSYYDTPVDNFNSREEFIQYQLERIIQANETITINAKVDEVIKNIETQEYKTVKEKIQNTNTDKLILNAIETKSEFDIAAILYKINIDKYSFKDFRSNLWINKNDTTIPSSKVFGEIRKQLSTIIIDIFTNYMNSLNEDRIEEKKRCNEINFMLKLTKCKNNIMSEAKEFFYNN
jgi:hypothetical protein